MSVGGFFKRALVEGKRKIVDVDFTEISATPVPVHPGTSLNLIAGKALADDLRVPDSASVTVPATTIRDSDFSEIQWALDTLDTILTRIGKRGDGNTSATTSLEASL